VSESTRSKEGIVSRRKIMTALAAAAAIVIAQPAIPQTNDEKLEITAWAVNMSNIATGTTAMVEFTVERWSTPEDAERLIATMIEQGQDALLRELQKMPSHGRMRFPSWEGRDPFNARLGWDLRYTRQFPLPEGGRRIVMALDRYISFWEARNQPRTIDYPFTLIEMRVDRNGEGEGKMSVATKIRFDKEKKVIELENYASEPVRLQNVRVKTKSRT
jgi:hypothetical protein